MKRVLCVLMVLMLFMPTVLAEEVKLPFAIRNGSRDEKKVAITVDDCFDMASCSDIFALAKEYQVPLTFFPLGCQLKEEDQALWQEIASSSCEIGSHTFGHFDLGKMGPRNIISTLGRTQEKLDEILTYHYQIRSVRPPFGHYRDENDNQAKVKKACNTYGVEHLVTWDVSETDAAKAIKKVKNGSILLYHTRPKDYRCLQTLIPQLLAQGYELVTVSELLGFGELETSETPYVYDSSLYYQ